MRTVHSVISAAPTHNQQNMTDHEAAWRLYVDLGLVASMRCRP
ncbi:hypothetical protein [Cumulibacter soli]|nr:hypothetical protein [Cumulibacter soli]